MARASATRAARQQPAATPAARAGGAAPNRRLLFGVIVAGAVVIAVLLIVLNRPGGSGPAVAIAAAELPMGLDGGSRVLGDPAAPVTIVEYGDYQCIHCGDFAREVEPELIRDLVSSGQATFAFHDLAFLGPESTDAALAAAAAARQGRFWDFHTTVFANQQGVNRGALTPERLRAMATGLGLDMAAYDAALADPALAAEVAQMGAEARDLGITGTPTFVINGVVTPWAGYEALQAAVAQAAQ